ncbi:MAG: sulfotransferase family 2 domain-containing protein [Nonlabens sp.]
MTKSEKNIIFLHLPKNAGTTFKSILSKYYDKENIFQVGYNSSGIWNMEELKSSPKEELAKINLLQGHFNYGIHEIFERDFRYITMLRNPIERTISFYNYIRRQKEHRLLSAVQNRTLLECITEIRDFDVINGQARKLSGTHNEDKMLDLALKNIDQHFDFVGIQERFDESLILLHKTYNWNKIFYKSLNKTSKQSEISPELISAITETNEIDMKLYEIINQRFTKELERINFLPTKLKMFNMINRNEKASKFLNKRL